MKGRKTKWFILFGAVFLLSIIPFVAFAAVPGTINYQGYLTDPAGSPISGTLQMSFSIYTSATGGSPVWTETQTVVVSDGVYSVRLGAVNPLTIAFNTQYWLAVEVEADGEMTPRQALTSVGYALNAGEADYAYDADLLDGQHATDIIAAASDEVRTAISSCPYTISSSGSYYLTGDLTSTGTCITVSADNVTIDLMGFSIIGPGTGTNYGIYMSGRSNVEIKNGTVRGFYNGIYEDNSSGKNHRLINVRAVGNGGDGIRLYSYNNLVKDCTASDNGNNGIVAYSGSTVTGNTAYNNGDNGIVAYHGCTVTDNTAYGNGGNGIYAGVGCTVTGNTAYNNQDYGIYLTGNSLVDGNTAYANNQSGGSYTNIKSCSTCTFGTNHAP